MKHLMHFIKAGLNSGHQALTGFLCLLVLSFTFTGSSTLVANAQSDQLSKTYITPFPQGGKYKVYVVGASLAQGTYNGLVSAFSKDRNIELKSRIKYSSGLAVSRGFNWKNDLEALVAQDKMDIVIVLIGLKELSTIYKGRKGHKVGTKEWSKILGDRIDAKLKSLKSKNVAVYWVGLPIMRSPKLNEKMQLLNDVFRKHAFLNGVKFIDTWNGFTDQFNRYSAFGPDINGNVRRIRENDGVHLTGRGYRKLAHFVEKEIRRDMKLAKAERNIPLAGAREEQSRIAKDNSNKPKISKRYSGKTPENAKPLKKEEKESFFARFLGGAKTDNKAKKSGGKLIEGIKIVRPPISDTVLSGSGVRNNPGSVSAITGDIIADEVGSGLTALASVTSANDLSLKDAKRRVPIKETPYYRVLVSGETLTPKPGRVDDFTWKQ
ncbi:MAG: SGNH/GDSL hydrolase family protein [Methyloligellaceae bacterium]